MIYDVAIVGLGATGAAAAFQLAKRGARIVGLDRLAPPHDHGSSHGETRITRLAIGEGDHLTPLAMRSHEIWSEVEQETGASLLTTTGGLIVSSEATVAETHVKGFFRRTLAAAEKFAIPHQLLDAKEIRARFPQFRVQDDEWGYFEPSAGYLRPEACIQAQLALAARHGADLRTGTRMLGFEIGQDSVRLRTADGEFAAERLILAAGSWLPQFLDAPLAKLFRIYRQVQLWFEARGAARQFEAPHFPVFIWELRDARRGLYGFPAIGGGGSIKVASETFENTTTPETVQRSVSPHEIAEVYRDLVAPHLPAIGSRCIRTATCLYTVTPDFGFVIDRHPDSARVILASPCSGHGFKHSAAIGEALATLTLERESCVDLSPFRLSRFGVC